MKLKIVHNQLERHSSKSNSSEITCNKQDYCVSQVRTDTERHGNGGGRGGTARGRRGGGSAGAGGRGAGRDAGDEAVKSVDADHGAGRGRGRRDGRQVGGRVVRGQLVDAVGRHVGRARRIVERPVWVVGDVRRVHAKVAGAAGAVRLVPHVGSPSGRADEGAECRKGDRVELSLGI